MTYTTKYFEKLTSDNLRASSNTFEKAIINESRDLNAVNNFTGDEFDIFLSHSFLDKKIIYGIYLELTNLGYSVYIDWLKDPELDRSSVTKNNADLLRQRLFESKCLFYATTTNSKRSNWMPWELGFMDGFNQKVTVLPLIENHETQFTRLEYLKLYPYIEKAPISGQTDEILWVCENSKLYTTFDKWLSGDQLKLHE